MRKSTQEKQFTIKKIVQRKTVELPSPIQKVVQKPIPQVVQDNDKVENLKIELYFYQSKCRQLEQKVFEQTEVTNAQHQMMSQNEKDMRKKEDEVNFYLDKLSTTDDYIRKLKQKKKDYKDKVRTLTQQNEQLQNTTNPFHQLIEMRQLLIQMRLTTQILPLLTQQGRLRQFQTGFIDIDNMSYEQLLQLEDQMGTVNNGIARQDIRRIPKRIVQEQDRITDICTVCQCNLEVNERYRRLGCSHIYHSKCIKNWLLFHNDCPVCKRQVQIP